jgi:GTPase-associated system helical domain
VREAVEAAVSAGAQAVATLAQSVEAALASARRDVLRLAEEIDMLWWHIGDWHELLEKPRSAASVQTKMLASGIELAAFVQRLPGPFGAYGLLRKIAGSEADGKTIPRAAVKSLSENDARKLAKSVPSASIKLFPIHSAIQSLVERGTAGWESEFAKASPDIADVEMSLFELGIQAYRERKLINRGLGE